MKTLTVALLLLTGCMRVDPDPEPQSRAAWMRGVGGDAPTAPGLKVTAATIDSRGIAEATTVDGCITLAVVASQPGYDLMSCNGSRYEQATLEKRVEFLESQLTGPRLCKSFQWVDMGDGTSMRLCVDATGFGP